MYIWTFIMNVWIKYEHDLKLSVCGAQDSEVSTKLVLSNQEKSFIKNIILRILIVNNCGFVID